MKVNVLLKAFNSSSADLLTTAYCVYIRPLLESATPVWSPIAIGLTNELEDVQRQFTRRLFYRCRLPRASYRERLDALSLQSLEHRRAISDLKFIFDCVRNLASLDTSKLFAFPVTLRPYHNLAMFPDFMFRMVRLNNNKK